MNIYMLYIKENDGLAAFKGYVKLLPQDNGTLACKIIISTLGYEKYTKSLIVKNAVTSEQMDVLHNRMKYMAIYDKTTVTLLPAPTYPEDDKKYIPTLFKLLDYHSYRLYLKHRAKESYNV